MIVLWGQRKGDVLYASRDYWRRNIPLGAPTIEVHSAAVFDVGDSYLIRSGASPQYGRIVGKHGNTLGVVRS